MQLGLIVGTDTYHLHLPSLSNSLWSRTLSLISHFSSMQVMQFNLGGVRYRKNDRVDNGGSVHLLNGLV